MKKLLLSTAAVGLALAAVPAHAELNLDFGGYFKGYGVWVNQDDAPNQETGEAGSTNDGAEESDSVDFVRDTELHVNGESTLDNGLTVGAHVELSADGADGATTADESYAYFSGSWGRVNFGDEDGAGYLLQVAAPSADSNVDGVRQFVQPFNYDAMFYDRMTDAQGTLDSSDASQASFIQDNGGLDYDMDVAGKSTKLTYLSPVFSGFQVGMSFTPNPGVAGDLEGVGLHSNTSTGAGTTTFFGDVYEAAARYEGQWDKLGVALGAGWTFQNLEASASNVGGSLTVFDPTDDRKAWNAGADFNLGPFGLGVGYMRDDHGKVALEVNNSPRTPSAERVVVVGADYTTGPFKIGASYLDSNNTFGLSQIISGNVEAMDSSRITGGVVYTYGPGMTFNGSLSYVEHEYTNAEIGDENDHSVDGTALMLGTQVNF